MIPSLNRLLEYALCQIPVSAWAEDILASRCRIVVPVLSIGPVEPLVAVAAALLALYVAGVELVLGQYLLAVRPAVVTLVAFGHRIFGPG